MKGWNDYRMAENISKWPQSGHGMLQYSHRMLGNTTEWLGMATECCGRPQNGYKTL